LAAVFPEKEAALSVLDRLRPSDLQRARMAGLVWGRPGMPGSTGRDSRMFVGAVPWIVRNGAPFSGLLPAGPADGGSSVC
jgi:hypothetical protein